MTSRDDVERRRYQFGHLPPGTALGGLAWSQLAILIAGGVWLVGCLQVLASPAGALAGVVGGVVCALAALTRAAGRTAADWARVIEAFARRRARGHTRFRASAPREGIHPARDRHVELPEHLTGLRIVGIPVEDEEIGAVVDGDALVLVLSVASSPFALLDSAAQERRLAGWGAVLSSLGRAGSPVERVQWIERTGAEPSDEIGAHLRDNVALPVSHRSVASYLALADDAAPVTRAHEVLLALRVRPRRTPRLARRLSRGADSLARVAVREAAALARQLSSLEVGVAGALPVHALCAALRTGFDPLLPASRPPAGRGGETSLAPHLAGPMAAEEGWGVYRTDGAVHVTYWIAEWPRTEVGCDVLMPLVLADQARRSVSVVMEPRDPARALRDAENARTQEAADEDMRDRAGFATTARRRRQQQAISRREAELADGHAAYRFSGYVTVSATSLDELDEACAAVEQAAQMARCELRRLWGEQATGFAATLPLCRGLS